MKLWKYNTTNISACVIATSVYLPQNCTLCQAADHWLCGNTDVAMQDMELVSQATQFVDLVLATDMKL